MRCQERRKDREMMLSVADDGVGFPDSIDFKNTGSLGLAPFIEKGAASPQMGETRVVVATVASASYFLYIGNESVHDRKMIDEIYSSEQGRISQEYTTPEYPERLSPGNACFGVPARPGVERTIGAL
jgi:hypothetical protein